MASSSGEDNDQNDKSGKSGGGWLGALGRSLTPAASQERAQRARDHIQSAEEAKLTARGQWFVCPACGWHTTSLWVVQHARELHGKAPDACPICRTHADGTPPTEKQVVRIYVAHKDGVGGDVDEAFQREAAQMVKAGWLVQSTQYGGVGMAGEGTVVALAPSWSRTRQVGARKPERVTVIYTRD